jgi:catechol 2,3-dioxygenase
LYHFAVLLPDREALGRSLYRLAATQTALQGAADHWFSEAIYLADPEGNGIELYRDRPRAEWPAMDEVAQRGNGYFDLRQLLNAVQRPPQPGEWIDAGTRLGHMHLRVSDIPSADRFYIDALGFDLMMRYGGRAGFVSAGGYHHHVAYNTWESAGAPIPAPGSAGLSAFSVALPDAAALAATRKRLEQAGVSLQESEDGLMARDPAGIGVILMLGE